MRRLQNLLLAVLTLGLLSACASLPQQAYDPADRQQIKTIGLLTPSMASDLDVRMMIHPGASFGIVGALIAEGDMSKKSEKFSASVRAHNFSAQREMAQYITAALQRAGYTVVPVSVNRDIGEQTFMESYAIANSPPVDAYLDLYTTLVGYTAAGATTAYRPTVRLGAKLVRAGDQQTLYTDHIWYNPFGEPKDAITLAASSRFDYDDFDALIADSKRATDGLHEAMTAASEALSQQLR
ncbi:hypothetical protein [Polycyclovorans algicola]|uniref:hypothetical protein n=1 Tax=Polycyclovorans algicola TaxID=616992 RepID=UPI0004A74155|nr:hypothetical protein [Polycyclovorans algicola]